METSDAVLLCSVVGVLCCGIIKLALDKTGNKPEIWAWLDATLRES